MIPAKHDIDIYRGDDFEMIFRWKDSVTNSYFNLTGYTGAGQIRAAADDDTVLATFNVTLLDQSTTPGGILVRLTPTQTADLPLTGGVYDVEVANAGRTWVRTPIAGDVSVIAEVTRT